MKKNEAIALEALTEKRLKSAIERDVTVSMALSGNLKVDFDDGYICFRPDSFAAENLSYTGDYVSLMLYVDNIRRSFVANQDDIKRLIWSYENRTKLVDEGASSDFDGDALKNSIAADVGLPVAILEPALSAMVDAIRDMKERGQILDGSLWSDERGSGNE